MSETEARVLHPAGSALPPPAGVDHRHPIRRRLPVVAGAGEVVTTVPPSRRLVGTGERESLPPAA
jgi:hypothetical protein